MPHGGDAGGLLRAFDGPTLLVCAPGGDVEGNSVGGLYHHDTRYLSLWRLRIEGKPLVLLTAHPLDSRRQLFYLTNPETGRLPSQALTVRRERTIGAGMTETITVASHLQGPVKLQLEVAADADFSSVMEVQRGYAEPAGRWRTRTGGRGPVARWAFEHDCFTVASEVSSSAPARVTVARRSRHKRRGGAAPTSPARFRYRIKLAPHQTWQTEFRVVFQQERERLEPIAERLASRPAPAGTGPPEPAVSADWPAVRAVCERSLADLAALRFEAVVEGRRLAVPAAGIPWYLAIIGRDTLWTAYQTLPFTPALAAGALGALAGRHHPASAAISDHRMQH